jgi:hypothetical protein
MRQQMEAAEDFAEMGPFGGEIGGWELIIDAFI